MPVFLGLLVADRTVDKPAEVAGVEFPGGAVFFLFWRTSDDVPTVLVFEPYFFGEEKEKLSFHMRGDCPPPLFIAADSLKRRAQQRSQLFLGFF